MAATPDFKKILEKLQAYVYSHDVHPVDVFQMYDRHNSRKITTAQFRRCIDINRFPLSEPEIDLIVQKYVIEGSELIDYHAFCGAITKIYTNIKLEVAPLKTTMDAHAVIDRALNRPNASGDEAFLRLLAKFAHQVRTKGIHIREAYMDFDPHNSGMVTYPRFVRALPFEHTTDEDVQILRKYYQDPVVKDMNYRRLHMDVLAFIEHNWAAADSQQAPWLAHQLQSVHVKSFDHGDSLVQALALHVYEKRIRVKEFFQQHDPLRKGVVTPNKFEGVLTLLGFPLTQADLDALAAPYRTTDHGAALVKWEAFCNDLDARATAGSAQERTVGHPAEAVERVLVKIRGLIQRSKINVAPTMQDFDRAGRGFVTPSQLHRALASLKIAVTEDEMAILAQRFGDDSRGGIDIYSFIEAVDPDQKEARRAFRPLGTTRESVQQLYGQTPSGDRFVTGEVADELIEKSRKGLIPRVGARTAGDEVLEDLRKWAYVKGVHFAEFMQDFDTHTLGEISAPQFRRSMSTSRAPVTEEEVTLLVEKYKSPTRDNYVCWKRFSQDIMEFVAPLELEKEPLVDPGDPRRIVCK